MNKKIPKDKKLFKGIKSGANSSEIELFCRGFKQNSLVNYILKVSLVNFFTKAFRIYIFFTIIWSSLLVRILHLIMRLLPHNNHYAFR